MGLNAVTTVPVYVAAEVLTAADLNITNSGIPVFATTVTRDAAFGGAGEKTLAEGQFAYIEATNATQYYDGASWISLGALGGQVASVFKADTFSFTSTSFIDVTGLSVSITPTAATSRIMCLGQINTGTSASEFVTVQLVRTATAIGNGTGGTTYNAISSNAGQSSAGMWTTPIMFVDSPATTSATTYKLQVKTSAGTSYVGRRASDTAFGGSSSLILMEIPA